MTRRYLIALISLSISLVFLAPRAILAFSLDPQYMGQSDIFLTISGSDITDFMSQGATQINFYDSSSGLMVGSQNIDNSFINDSTTIDTSVLSLAQNGVDIYVVPVHLTPACDTNHTFTDCMSGGFVLSSGPYQTLYYDFPPNNLSDTGGTPVFTEYPPTVVINSALSQKILSGTTTISYQATDQNDNGYDVEKTQYGLPKNPVFLYYSDKIADWYGAPVPDPFKSIIASGQPPVGNYAWSPLGLTPGAFYRIVADATDRGGVLGEGISGVFTVDFTPPSFVVKADPAAVRSGTVKIAIDASKDLPSTPQVTVAQQGGPSTPLVLSGTGSHFTASYNVQSGYDGTAVISVTGTDAAGNVGTSITSGGTFNVGQNPPPAPTIAPLANGGAASGDFIDIQGTARSDTTLILKVNGAAVATTTPLSSGSFLFKGIRLDKSKNQGKNAISISAVDVFGAMSEPATVEAKRNIPPVVSMLKPQSGAVVSDQSNIALNASDENGDTLSFTYEVALAAPSGANPKESDWQIVGDSIPSSGFVWDTTAFADGPYMIRALAYDGTAISTSTSARVIVKNTLPFLRFDDGRQTFSKDSSVVVSGHAMEPASLAVAPTITTIEYSLDGKKWTLVPFSAYPGSDTGNRFSLSLSDLKEGSYPMLWRVKDSRGLFGRTTHTVVVDRTPPKAPVIETPQDGAVLSSGALIGQAGSGLITTISGRAEPGSVLSLIYDSRTLAGKALPDGRFSFQNVAFSARGKHQISVSAADAAGNSSVPATIALIYDDPPIMEFSNPKPFGGISGVSTVSWKIQDSGPSVTRDTSISYRRAGGSWKTLAVHAPKTGSSTLDVSALPEANDYELRILSDDGIVPASYTESFSVDRTPPSITSAAIALKRLSNGGLIIAQGRAVDAVSGVDAVEYSLKGATTDQTPWYSGLITSGHLGQGATFQIKYPNALADGSYALSLRAVDAAGNLSKESGLAFSLDNTAPRVGSFFIESDGVFVSPDQSGLLTIPEGSKATFGVSLEGDTATAALSVGGQRVALEKNIASGLWEAPVSVGQATTSQLALDAADGLGNKISGKAIGSLRSESRGRVSYQESGVDKPLIGVSVRVLKLNDDTGSWVAEKGAVSDAEGGYSFALGRGTYRIVAQKAGWKTIEKDLSLAEPRFVDFAFGTRPVSGFEAWWQSIVDRFRY